MNIYIEHLQRWLDMHPKAKQWGWFIILWCVGLFSVMAIAYPIKLIIKMN